MYDYGIVLLQVRITFLVHCTCDQIIIIIIIVYYFIFICFSVGAWGRERHPKSVNFPEESNGPGYHLFMSFLLNPVQHLHISQCFSQSSVPQGFVPAINALAWYYEQFEQDYVKAVQLWEQADLLESPDAALNLGVMYSQGLYPGKAADKVSSTTVEIYSVVLYYYACTIALSAYIKR